MRQQPRGAAKGAEKSPEEGLKSVSFALRAEEKQLIL